MCYQHTAACKIPTEGYTLDYPNSVPSAGLVDVKFVDENPITGTPGSSLVATHVGGDGAMVILVGGPVPNRAAA